MQLIPPVDTVSHWNEARKAAYQAKYINDEISLLNSQSAALKTELATTQARIAAEAAAKTAADKATADAAAKAAAEQTRLAAEAIRVANTFRAPGSASATGPVVISAVGTINVIETAAVTLQAAIRSAIAELTSLLAGTASGLLVGVSTLAYSPKLANGELPERYTFSTPLSDLDPEQNQDLLAIAATSGTVNLPVRLNSKTAADGQSEVIIVKTDSTTIPSSVRVVAATYDAAQNVYSVTTGDTPRRTLTWTPIVNPGNSSTTSPAEQPAPPVYTGATVTPVESRIDTFPGGAEAGFDDFITVFPADSGLPPIYVMFRDRREDPGVVTGVGQPVSGIWLGTASQGEGAPIPSQIADQLRGKEFKNFRAFREAFWKAVAGDPELSKQFDPGSVAAMEKGYAAFVRKIERAGARKKYELHH
ncbi:S-type pyocin domain-containing protein [Pseudomonas sp. BRG-100]|uniref:S-type pyocin domain-containing protein n=1 Tax=Pseudomonas sp. BRG-100 TaxID=1524267 RepID=UPI0006ACD644|nr:S-type pyocin domain-containing protein [Pseudomonas sp. BRG-100]